MSNIRESLKHGLTTHSGQSTLRNDARKAAQVIDRLFARFETLYAKQWIDAKNDRNGWTRELADFTLAEIAYAVGQVEKRYTDWPPTLIIFKSICGEIPRPKAESDELFKGRPRDPEIARKHKAMIRAIIGMPDGDHEGLAEFLESPQHEANVRRMVRR